MTRLEAILIIVLVVILLVWLFVVSFLIFSIYKNGKIQQGVKTDSINAAHVRESIKSPFNTGFFNSSAEYAERVLFGHEADARMGPREDKMIDAVSKLNSETKERIVTAMKYMSIEPSQARANENSIRASAESAGVPLWFAIFSDAVKKVVPEFSHLSEPAGITSSTHESKIIPLYGKAG